MHAPRSYDASAHGSTRRLDEVRTARIRCPHDSKGYLMARDPALAQSQLFAGLGINVISHVLTTHLVAAEKRFADEQATRAARPEV